MASTAKWQERLGPGPGAESEANSIEKSALHGFAGDQNFAPRKPDPRPICDLIMEMLCAVAFMSRTLSPHPSMHPQFSGWGDCTGGEGNAAAVGAS
jgi:hypothetical protein